jgi:triphosphatase
MQEIELKFQVPFERRADVDAAVAGRVPTPRTRLQAIYFDTPTRALAHLGMALRIRREGRAWVQTLKGAGDDGLTRAEHNVRLSAASQVADPALHEESGVGKKLIALLAEPSSGALAATFSTDIRRRTRRVRVRGGVVELAFDDGWIVAGDQRLRVCELEIELVSGSPAAVIAASRSWVRRHGLWLDTRSKAERGDMLARGEAMAIPREASPVRLDPDCAMDEALKRVLRNVQDQILVNASQVASGDHGSEHVHQLRVGLRRLRTALKLFKAEDLMPQLAMEAASLFRDLGAARDRDVIEGPLRTELEQALDVAGSALAAPSVQTQINADEPARRVRSTSAQMAWLDLLDGTQAAGSAGEEPHAAKTLVRRLQRLHRRVKEDVKQLHVLDDASLHALRKRAKRLRYGVEFGVRFFEKRDARRYLRSLKTLLDALGERVDLNLAFDSFKARDEKDPAVAFALGWLAARRSDLAANVISPLRGFPARKVD